MARIKPFRGIRYNPDRFPSLADVVSPPYDVISPSTQTALHARSPFNVVRMELGQAHPDDDTENTPHSRAGDFLRRWLAEGILIQEDRPALYLTATTFPTADAEITRWGLMASVGLEPFERGLIRPHERTYSKVKSERLSLLRSCRANLSPVFAFFSDPEAVLPQLVARATRAAPVYAFEDRDHHRHRMWIITHAELHRLVATRLGPQVLFIADGHHRYETALAYREARAAREGGLPENHPANFTLMYLSRIQDPGLTILPAHRLLPRVAPEIRRRFLERAASYFHLEKLAAGGPARRRRQGWLKRLDQTLPGEGLVVAMAGEESPYLLQLKGGDKGRLYSEATPDMLQDIDVTLLTDFIFPQLLELTSDQLDDVDQVRYDHDARRAIDKVHSGQCDMAFIIKPTPIAAVQRIADAGRVMPRKSTYFAPKVITGLVMRAL